MKKQEELSLLFVSSQFLEQLFWKNKDILNGITKAKFEGILLRLKNFNKDIEKDLPELSKEQLEEDTEQLYDICNLMVKATLAGKDAEFMKHIKEFKI